MPQNIDDFNTGVALIMGRLYEAFPAPIQLCGSDFPEIPVTEGDPDALRKIDRYLDLASTYFQTSLFLLEEGYLRGDRVEGRTFLNNCTLTSKGLAALQRTPKALQSGHSSIGTFFLSLGKDVAREAAKEAVKSGVKALLRGG